MYDFDAARYVVEQLPSNARVLMLWDGQGYYCDERCLPDTAQSRAPFLMQRAGASLEDWREAIPFTHVLVDLEGANFMVQHDPTGEHRAGLGFALRSLDRCGEIVFSNEKTALYAWRCGSNANGPIRETSPSRTSALRSLFGDLTVGQASEW